MELSPRAKEIGAIVFTVVLLGLYVAVNWDAFFHAQASFILTTVGLFMWLVLAALFIIHEVVEALRKEMGYMIEDNIVEIKLLKELTEKQIEEMQMLHNAIATMRASSVAKASSKKKR